MYPLAVWGGTTSFARFNHARPDRGGDAELPVARLDAHHPSLATEANQCLGMRMFQYQDKIYERAAREGLVRLEKHPGDTHVAGRPLPVRQFHGKRHAKALGSSFLLRGSIHVMESTHNSQGRAI